MSNLMKNLYRQGESTLEDLIKIFTLPGYVVATYNQWSKVKGHSLSRKPKWKVYGESIFFELATKSCTAASVGVVYNLIKYFS